MQRESAWKKQQSILEEDSNSLSILKKEITKQSQIDVAMQLSISQKIEVLKQNATALAKKLQNQKHKNVELEAIIAHLKTSLEKEKNQEASFRESNNSENLIGLENRYKKNEYDLGQLNGKANRIAENVEKKRTKISQNRTQRVIDSGIFRNIEKQIVQSELTFKKLLIEKIKYQKQYEKLLKNYESLKGHAENHSQQSSARFKNESSDILYSSASDVIAAANKKFTNLNTLKDSGNAKPKSMTLIEEQQQFQEQKNIIIIKKLLSQTGLESCEEIIYNFNHIDEINEKYYNQMMVYVDQSNQIQKYLNEIRNFKQQNKLHFYEEARRPTKMETFKAAQHKCRTSVHETTELAKAEMEQIHNFFKDAKFKQILIALQINQPIQIDQRQNLEDFKLIIQNLQNKINAILSKEALNHDGKYKTSRSNQHQKLQELMSRVRRSNQYLDVMGKEDFKAEYHQILKATASKTTIAKPTQKKASYIRVKK